MYIYLKKKTRMVEQACIITVSSLRYLKGDLKNSKNSMLLCIKEIKH